MSDRPSPQPEPPSTHSQQPLVVPVELSSASAVPGSSASSLPAGSGLRGPASQPDQKTVISQGVPLAAANHPLRPADLGKSLEGQSLGHFKLEEFVGGGGMGAVFRAIDTMLGRTVAVKVVGSAGADDDTLRRFRNEAQSAARLDHENIARVYYVGEDAGWNYIVFEFIEGVNIRDLVEHKGPLSLDEAVTYTLQVADALEHASRRDVVHRDIKPSNVLVTADGRAKLVDMGLARLHQVESSAEDLTASGVTLGTFDYISPEQARDPRATDVRSDLYSLGCTFYFMLTGFPPFPHGTVLQKLLSHSSEEPPDPSQYRDDLTEEVIAIINKLLAKSPRDRYQQPRDLIVDLKLLAEQLGLSSASHAGKIWIAPAQPQESFAERHLPWLVPVATLLLVVLLLDRFSQSDEPLEIAPPDLATRVVPVSQGSSAAAGVQPSILPAGSLEGDRKRSSPFARPAGDGDGAGATRGQVRPEAGPAREAIPPPSAGGPIGPAGDLPPAVQVVERPQPAAGASAGAPVAGAATRRNGESGTSRPEPGEVPAGTAVRPGPMTPSDNPRAVAGGGAASGETPAASLQGAGDVAAPGPEPVAADVPQPPESAVDPARVTRIVVAPDDLPVGPEARRAASLKLALALASQMPLVTRIELHVPGTQTIMAPLDFPADLLVGRELTVAAGAGYQPRILFRPQPQDLGDTQRPRMLRVTQGSLRLVGLHLRFELPADDRQGWSLFYLDRVESLYLEQCTLTVHNPYGSLLDDRVAFFEVASPRENDPAANGSAADETRAVVTNLSLLRCSARGQATLVRAERSVPLRLTWQQGFFSTTQGLLDVGGLKTPPRFEQGIIGLELRHVTAVVGPGLCRLRTDASYPHQRDVNAQFENCVFVASESPSPLFEYRGTLSMEEVRARITVKGFGNYYDGTDVILRVRSPEAFDLPLDVTFSPEDRLRAGDERWYREVEPQPAAMLNLQLRARPGQATEQHTPADFQVLRREESMEAQSAGFDLSQIPQFPSDKLPPPGEPASLPPAAEPASSLPVPPL